MVNFLGITQNISHFIFKYCIEVERSEPSVEPGTIILKGLDIHVFINFGTTSFHIELRNNKSPKRVKYFI